jgi:hypothetical protein
MRQLIYILFSFILCFFGFEECYAQSFDIALHWNLPVSETVTENARTIFLQCEEANINEEGWPQITRYIPLSADIISVSGILSKTIFVPLTVAETEAITGKSLPTEVVLDCNFVWERKKPGALVSFVPLRLNPGTGIPEKLVSCVVTLSTFQGKGSQKTVARSYAAHSVLATGNWYKIGVKQSGICRITYSDLTSMGINPSQIDPRNIRVYGNGGGMLPENNSSPRQDDLAENAIEVVGEADGSFNEGDYILFYAKGPVSWSYNSTLKLFVHSSNLYSEMACYFITTDLGPGRRIVTEPNSVLQATDIVNQFDDYAVHEKDLHNLIMSGRQWLGESFDIETNFTFNFNFPYIVLGSDVILRSYFATHSFESSSYSLSAAGIPWNITVGPISAEPNSTYARSSSSLKVLAAVGPSIDVNVRYNKPLSGSLGWIDFIEVNARRNLTFAGGDLLFRDSRSALPGHVAQYLLAGATASVKVWDVTDNLNVSRVETTIQGSNLTFRAASDSIREFAAFDGTSFVPMSFIGKVGNQDLHAQRGFNMLIICPSVFNDQANRLATYHAAADGLNPIVVDPQLIYNEFSSGVQDITAIRDYIKMVYDLGNGDDTLSYVLLFGDGSYDNMNRLEQNTNFIPTYQSPESFHPVDSYVTDDYYGYLDNGEGNGAHDMLDVGIGRLPVKTGDEARQAVDKILHYDSHTPVVMGDWRNVICFVADDQDDNEQEHVIHSEELATLVNTLQSNYNVDKIYSDAYKQVSAPGGQRYPDVNKAINLRVGKGALIINYIGHGGEVGWAHERILGVQDINSWDNYDRLPVFLTATCEFSRFDDPGRTSAGELVFLNPHGGGVALFTTTRATYGSPNMSLNKSFYRYAFSTDSMGRHIRMGDIFLKSKRESGSDPNGKKFILLGDPALRMAYPDLEVKTISINNRPVSEGVDTIRALSHVVVTGKITDKNSQTVTGFNGSVTPTVFDKATPLETLANDGGSKFAFKLQKSALYKGTVEVKNGIFSFSFIVPRDIAYQYDFGRISYYASDSTRDAAGSFKDIVVGGLTEGIVMDKQGPLIDLFMNDDRFVTGGITDENPALFARVSDENGINTLGNGIGHDIVAVLDNASDQPLILNDYYQAEKNTFTSGEIKFPFSNLSPGLHTLSLKVWDVFNNSSEAYTEFNVKPSSSLTLGEVMNYPNPFRDQTYFTFEHNQPEKQMEVSIDIFDLSGKKIKTVSGSVAPGGYRTNAIPWDGSSENGFPLRSGMYIYRITVTTTDGQQQHGSGKLAIAR